MSDRKFLAALESVLDDFAVDYGEDHIRQPPCNFGKMAAEIICSDMMLLRGDDDLETEGGE